MLKKIAGLFKSSKSEVIDDPPPSYGEVIEEYGRYGDILRAYEEPQNVESQIDFDLLAQCNIHDKEADNSNEEIEAKVLTPDVKMGHRPSKVSLTWVLRESADLHHTSCAEKIFARKSEILAEEHIIQRNNLKLNNNYYDSGGNERIVGRNAKQFKCHINTEVTKNAKSDSNSSYCDSWLENKSNYEHNTFERKYRQRRKRTKHSDQENFGYEIKDIDTFLTKASIDSPGNIPVVVTHPSILYQTQRGNYQREGFLSLGMVVNAIFKNQQWLYVQTPHGEEGYILYASCLPLGILPTIQRYQSYKRTPCWESTLDLYPPPCGNMTDTEKEQLHEGSKSECGRGRSNYIFSDTMSTYSEKTFDKLYLKATANSLKSKQSCDISKHNLSQSKNDVNYNKCMKKKQLCKESFVTRQTLMVIESDFEGSKSVNTLSVRKGEVVVLLQGDNVEADVDCEWFYVRNKNGSEGFIPASIAGHGYL